MSSLPEITSFRRFLSGITIQTREKDIVSGQAHASHYRSTASGDLSPEAAREIVGLSGTGGRPAIADILRAYGFQVAYTPTREQRATDIDTETKSLRGYSLGAQFPMGYVIAQAGIEIPDNADAVKDLKLALLLNLVKPENGTSVTNESLTWLRKFIYCQIVSVVDQLNNSPYEHLVNQKYIDIDGNAHYELGEFLKLKDCKGPDHFALCPKDYATSVRLITTLCGIGGKLREAEHGGKRVKVIDFFVVEKIPCLKIEIMDPPSNPVENRNVAFDHCATVSPEITDVAKELRSRMTTGLPLVLQSDHLCAGVWVTDIATSIHVSQLNRDCIRFQRTEESILGKSVINIEFISARL
jgi:hypothetical protein